MIIVPPSVDGVFPEVCRYAARRLRISTRTVEGLRRNITRKLEVHSIAEPTKYYAGKHKGQFPQKLSDITNVEIPNDPVTQKQFEYKSTGTEATIQIEGTEGSEGRDSVKYKLNLRK